MKQFNLEEYLKNPSRQVVTRDGRKVRIICTDMIGTILPIIVLVKNPETLEEKLVAYTPGGRAAYLNEDLDIFFADEEAHKHEGWMNVCKYPDGARKTNGIIYSVRTAATEAISYTPQGVEYLDTIKIEWEEKV